ncbi:MAG: IS5 family transposase [Blastocatellales bacterium]|nr:IS5 family transposase [Blastocatellales bacterium]MCW5968924.1 IS5 family transposase [Blastocatellales bacterium]
MAQQQSYLTIWEVPDELWEIIKILLDEYDPPASTGRPRNDRRLILNAIIHRLRSGCQWNHLPREFGDDSTIHRVFQHWVKLGIFAKIWAALVAECDELEQVQWDWQAADGWMGKARMGGDCIGPNPTDRGKNGTKKSLLTDGAGGPLAIIIAPANVNDHKLLEQTLDSIVVERPKVTQIKPQHLCLDKAYDNKPSREIVKQHQYKDHTCRIGEEKLDQEGEKKHPPRRYVVERTLAWLSRCRGLLIRYEKKSENYLAQLQFACALLWYRRLLRAEAAIP